MISGFASADARDGAGVDGANVYIHVPLQSMENLKIWTSHHTMLSQLHRCENLKMRKLASLRELGFDGVGPHVEVVHHTNYERGGLMLCKSWTALEVSCAACAYEGITSWEQLC